MSTYYRAAIVVGVQWQDITDPAKVESLIADDWLDVISPHHSRKRHDNDIIGLICKSSDDYSPEKFVWDEFNQHRVDVFKAKFEKLTGQEAGVWLTPYGYQNCWTEEDNGN